MTGFAKVRQALLVLAAHAGELLAKHASAEIDDQPVTVEEPAAVESSSSVSGPGIA